MADPVDAALFDPLLRAAPDPAAGPDGPEGADVVLLARAAIGRIVLRGDAADRAFVDAVRSVFGVRPPTTPSTLRRRRGNELLWLGPDTWLLLCPRETVGDLVGALEAALTGVPSQVVDTSDAGATIRLSGPGARRMMMRLTTLDVHPLAFPSGRVARTTLALTHGTVVAVDDAPTFDIHVGASACDYLWHWMVDAGRGATLRRETEAR